MYYYMYVNMYMCVLCVCACMGGMGCDTRMKVRGQLA